MEIRQDGLESTRTMALICPACSSLDESSLTMIDANWLSCSNPDCYQRYRVVDGIPRLLTKFGDFLNRKEVEEYAPTYRSFKTPS